MERPSWLLFKGLRCFHFLKSRQRKCEKSFINSKAYRRMQNDKHSSNLQLYSNIISFQNILFRSYSNKKSFSTLQKPNSKQQAIKNCLLQPSPLEPQCQLSHKNSSRLRSHSARRPLEDTPELPQVQNSLPHLPIKDYPPHQISLMREIISLKVHFIQDSSS